MLPNRSLYIYLITIAIVLGIGIVAGMVINESQVFAFRGESTPQDQPALNTRMIEQAWNIIQDKFADRSTLEKTNPTYAAISGMVDSLGDTGHSVFLTPKMVEEQKNFTEGSFEGIGAYVDMKDGHPIVVATFENSPARKAGLKAGDIILEVNGESTDGWSITQVVNHVLGPAGTVVRLTIQDPDTAEKREVEITRAKIQVENVTWAMIPGTRLALVRLEGFSRNVTEDLQGVLEEIQKNGATGMVLDLRANPGGLLDEAIGVTSQFLTTGNVLLEKDAQGQVKEVPVREGGLAADIPLVILINQGTASAAEIVSGALQDYGRARLVGETTFGTGTVLLQFPLEDGSAILLATELWLTPKGRVIWHQGIEPDEKTSLPEDVDAVIPRTLKEMTAGELQRSGDAQLFKAIELLSNEAAMRQAAQPLWAYAIKVE